MMYVLKLCFESTRVIVPVRIWTDIISFVFSHTRFKTKNIIFTAFTRSKIIIKATVLANFDQTSLITLKFTRSVVRGNRSDRTLYENQ